MTEALLLELAEELGVAIEVLWGALLKQARINAVIHVAETLAWAAVLWAAIRVKLSEGWLEREDPPWRDIGIAVWRAVAGLLAFLYLLDFGPEVVTPLLNPEYWALKEVGG